MSVQGEELGLAQRKSVSRSPASPASASLLDTEIAVLTRMIAERQQSLKNLKMRRKSLVNRKTMLRLHTNPDFVHRKLTGVSNRWPLEADKEAWRATCREAAKHRPNALPPMTESQRADYDNFTQNKRLKRAEALSILGIQDIRP